MLISAQRFHDFSYGHRVVGHENKCVGLHGHNGRVHFECRTLSELDAVGRVIDFSVINAQLCQWVEREWDHKMLLWEKDPLHYFLGERKDYFLGDPRERDSLIDALASIVVVPFNPTAEQMALHLLKTVGPAQLQDSGVYLHRVVIEETRKCSAVAELEHTSLC